MFRDLIDKTREQHEKDVVKRALSQTEHKGIRKFPYKGLDMLIDEVKALYPAAAHLVTCDLDNRDTFGTPQVTTRRLRSIKLSVVTQTGYKPSTSVNAVWHEVYAIVETGVVALKVTRFSIGETEDILPKEAQIEHFLI